MTLFLAGCFSLILLALPYKAPSPTYRFNETLPIFADSLVSGYMMVKRPYSSVPFLPVQNQHKSDQRTLGQAIDGVHRELIPFDITVGVNATKTLLWSTTMNTEQIENLVRLVRAEYKIHL